MQPVNPFEKAMQPGYQPQPSTYVRSFHSENISQEAREALDDIVQMFQAVNMRLMLLHENTLKCFRSGGKQQRLH